MKLLMLVKDINIRTLVSGDKQARITKVATLSDKMEVEVTVNARKEKGNQ